MEHFCCIRCGVTSDDGSLTVMIDTGEICCGNCDDYYTAADVRKAFAAWGPVLAWIESHPANKSVTDPALDMASDDMHPSRNH